MPRQNGWLPWICILRCGARVEGNLKDVINLPVLYGVAVIYRHYSQDLFTALYHQQQHQSQCGLSSDLHQALAPLFVMPLHETRKLLQSIGHNKTRLGSLPDQTRASNSGGGSIRYTAFGGVLLLLPMLNEILQQGEKTLCPVNSHDDKDQEAEKYWSAAIKLLILAKSFGCRRFVDVCTDPLLRDLLDSARIAQHRPDHGILCTDYCA